MSSRRSRNGGNAISTVFSRNSRSSRNSPCSIVLPRSALVAEMIRTLARRVLEDPTGSNSPVGSSADPQLGGCLFDVAVVPFQGGLNKVALGILQFDR